nr:hypothetical protein [Escherichia coli]
MNKTKGCLIANFATVPNGHRIARTDKASMPTVYSESLFVEVTIT